MKKEFKFSDTLIYNDVHYDNLSVELGNILWIILDNVLFEILRDNVKDNLLDSIEDDFNNKLLYNLRNPLDNLWCNVEDSLKYIIKENLLENIGG